ncbi:extracellular catalytic domain type 1 short-chain-length polyhydroxyalkanoate depolymerase [Haliangium sp.]|uniref:extracellular catalytic domain type 1 short-chain-length polyhydroxyalkanoate depolymerase n=1 Tax=Haliangium sp. TaxID=2663208 RepID=UPI003D0CECFA
MPNATMPFLAALQYFSRTAAKEGSGVPGRRSALWTAAVAAGAVALSGCVAAQLDESELDGSDKAAAVDDGFTTQATMVRVNSFGTNPGSLTMYRYVPDNLPAGAPLVVAMHGCTQSASEYLSGAGWNQMADRHGIAIVLPEQSSSNNSNKCFNWFEPGDYTRGQGEARSIVSMVDHMVSNFDIDTNRIFVTGLSAGGAMTSVMLAAYPDVFAGGAIMAGIPYKCANSVVSGFSCMSGTDKSPSQWGDLVRSASSFNGPWPVVSIWHGTSDYTVNQKNQTEMLEQWTDVHGVDRTADATSTVGNATRKSYHDAGGRAVVETWTLNGMGHATAVDPGTGTTQCGQTGAYFSDENVCSSYYAAEHWGLFGDVVPDPEPEPEPDPEPDPDPEPVPDPDPGHVCTESSDNNYQHVQAGRAYQSLGYVYANGSDDYMGLYNVFGSITLAETAPGFYEVGNCP